MFPRARGFLALSAAALLLGSCDHPTQPRTPAAEARVAKVGVVPGSGSARVGTTVQLRAVTRDSGNRVLDRPVTWSSSDSTVATVSTGGLVRVLQTGAVDIIASAEGVSGSARITGDERVATSLVVVPDSITLLPRKWIRLSAEVRDSSGEEITGRQISWSSSQPGVLRVYEDGSAYASGHDALVTVTARLGDLVGESKIHVLPDPCITTQQIGAAETVSANLTTAECRLSGGSYAARWRLEVPTARSLRIDLSSSAFDTYLLLTDLSGNTIEVDDDSGEGSDAQISGYVPAGSYIVWATSAAAGRTGAYTLAISDESRGPCEPSHPIGLGQNNTGYLSVLDCRYQSGQYVDRWRFDLSAPTTIRALMRSSAVDAFLTLRDLHGNLIMWDDDSGGGRDAEIATTLPAGSYVLWASSSGSNQRGRYALSLQQEQVSACRSAQPVHPGADMQGYLTTNDCRLSTGMYADRWRLDLGAYRELQIDLLSNAFDTYLIVTDLSGNTIISDNDSGPGSNARIFINLQSGSYIIWATSAAANRTGSYLLSVR